MVLAMATCCLEGTSLTDLFGGDHLCRRQRQFSGCKGMPRLPSASCHTRSPQILLSGVLCPRPRVFILLCQAASVASLPSDFGMWIRLLISIVVHSFFINRDRRNQGSRRLPSRRWGLLSNLTTRVPIAKMPSTAIAPCSSYIRMESTKSPYDTAGARSRYLTTISFFAEDYTPLPNFP